MACWMARRPVDQTLVRRCTGRARMGFAGAAGPRPPHHGFLLGPPAPTCPRHGGTPLSWSLPGRALANTVSSPRAREMWPGKSVIARLLARTRNPRPTLSFLHGRFFPRLPPQQAHGIRRLLQTARIGPSLLSLATEHAHDGETVEMSAMGCRISGAGRAHPEKRVAALNAARFSYAATSSA